MIAIEKLQSVFQLGAALHIAYSCIEQIHNAGRAALEGKIQALEKDARSLVHSRQALVFSKMLRMPPDKHDGSRNSMLVGVTEKQLDDFNASFHMEVSLRRLRWEFLKESVRCELLNEHFCNLSLAIALLFVEALLFSSLAPTMEVPDLVGFLVTICAVFPTLVLMWWMKRRWGLIERGLRSDMRVVEDFISKEDSDSSP